MMRRRFIADGIAVAAFGAAPRWVFSQSTPRVHRLAFVEERGTSTFSERAGGAPLEKIVFLERQLAGLGFVQGRNLELKHVFVQPGKAEVSDIVQEALAWNPDVFLVEASPLTKALRKATTATPIVFTLVGDPLRAGFVANLARPGGNTTGVTNHYTLLVFKRLELIREVLPNATRVAGVLDRNGEQYPGFFSEVREAGARLRLEVVEIDTAIVAGSEDVVQQVLRARVDGAIGVSALPGLQGRTPLELLLVLQGRGVPVVAGWISPSAESFVLQIGADPLDHFHRGIVIAARILSGEKASEISVDQDSRIFLTANLRAARTLGMKIPKALLLRADKVIE